MCEVSGSPRAGGASRFYYLTFLFDFSPSEFFADSGCPAGFHHCQDRACLFHLHVSKDTDCQFMRICISEERKWAIYTLSAHE